MDAKCIHHNTDNMRFWAGLFYCPYCGNKISTKESVLSPAVFPIDIREKQPTQEDQHVLTPKAEDHRKVEVTDLYKTLSVNYAESLINNHILTFNLYGDIVMFTSGVDQKSNHTNEIPKDFFALSFNTMLSDYQPKLFTQSSSSQQISDEVITHLDEYKHELTSNLPMNIEHSAIVDMCIHKKYLILRIKQGVYIIPAPYFRSKNNEGIGKFIKDDEGFFPLATYAELKDRFVNISPNGIGSVNWPLYSSMCSLSYDIEEQDEVLVMLKERDSRTYLYFHDIANESQHKNHSPKNTSLNNKGTQQFDLTEHVKAFAIPHEQSSFMIEKRDVGSNRLIVVHSKVVFLFNYDSKNGAVLKLKVEVPHLHDKFIFGTIQLVDNCFVIKVQEGVEQNYYAYFFAQPQKAFKLDSRHGVPDFFWVRKDQGGTSLLCKIQSGRYAFSGLDNIVPVTHNKPSITRILAVYPDAFFYLKDQTLFLNVNDTDYFLRDIPIEDVQHGKIFVSMDYLSHIWVGILNHAKLRLGLHKWKN